MPRIVGIDYGRKRIGVASCDSMLKIPFPYKTVLAGKTLPLTILEMQKALKSLQPIEALVLGLPLEMSGKEGIMAQEVRVFGTALQEAMGLEIKYLDERLTSAQVEKTFQEASYTRKERAQVSDTAAACLILETFIRCNYPETSQFSL